MSSTQRHDRSWLCSEGSVQVIGVESEMELHLAIVFCSRGMCLRRTLVKFTARRSARVAVVPSLLLFWVVVYISRWDSVHDEMRCAS